MARRAREAGSMADECVFHVNVNVNKLANKVCGLASGQRDRLTSTQRAVLTTTQENRSCVASAVNGCGRRFRPIKV